MPKHSVTATVAAGAAVLAAGILLTGCASLHALGLKHEQVDYASWADAPKHAGPASTPPPFVPHDASNLYIRTLLDGKGAAITYTSTRVVNASTCVPGTLTGRPKLDSNWWPTGRPPLTGLVCGNGWQLFLVDGVTYGWRNTP